MVEYEVVENEEVNKEEAEEMVGDELEEAVVV